jgi:hypothetical protein
MYQTDSYSLDFWLRMQVRLATAFAEGRKKLAEYRELTFPAAIDDADLGRKRATASRADALKLLSDLEALRVLMNSVEGQIRPVYNEADLPSLLSNMACVRDILETFQSISGLPPRAPAEEDLTEYERRFNGLKNLGNGETAVADRERLRTQVVNLRALGREEGARYEEQARRIETSLDHMLAQVQNIKTRTYLAIDVAQETIALLSSFNIKVFEVPDPIPEGGQGDANGAGAPAGEPVAPAGAGEAADAPPANPEERIEPHLPEAGTAAPATEPA